MTKHVLSELEGVCLGLVRKHEPCTAYQVRQALKVAPSSHWRASAGSVYPLLSRMEEKELIVKTADPADRRGRMLLQISHQGRAALRTWLLTGSELDVISSMTDPVRSRLFFLDVLNDAQRTNYLDEVTAEMENYLDKTRDHLATMIEDDDLCAYLGSLGAVRIAEARLEWLREVMEAFNAPSAGRGKRKIARRTVLD